MEETFRFSAKFPLFHNFFWRSFFDQPEEQSKINRFRPQINQLVHELPAQDMRTMAMFCVTMPSDIQKLAADMGFENYNLKIFNFCI